MRKILFGALLPLALAPASRAQDTLQMLEDRAVKAYRAKDYKTFLALEKRALALAPGNPRLLYDVACGEALTGDARGAVARLDRLAARKLDLGGETDPDFAGIRNTPDWREFEARLVELRRPLVRSSVLFTLDDRELAAAGIAADPSAGDTFVASVRERKILRRTKDGTVSDFVREGQDGFLAGASLAVDSARRLLYASTSAVPFMRGYTKEDAGRSGLFAFDLATGKLARKVFLPPDGKRHFLNQLAVARDGTVYVSDSGSPGIYRLSPGADELAPFLVPGQFRSTQGIALSEDEKTLYVADFSDGLWAVDMASKARRPVAAPADSWLGGLDGLSRVPGGFLAVQIGVRPPRVLRLALDPTGTRIAAVEILEMNHPDYDGPVQGAVAGGAFLYVADSQLSLGDGRTGAFAAERAKPTVVLRLPL